MSQRTEMCGHCESESSVMVCDGCGTERPDGVQWTSVVITTPGTCWWSKLDQVGGPTGQEQVVRDLCPRCTSTLETLAKGDAGPQPRRPAPRMIFDEHGNPNHGATAADAWKA